MGTVSKFEELIAWQKARELIKAIYRITFAGAFAQDYALSLQIRATAVSVMANIAEGFERGRRSEFHPFLSTAKASCAEVRSHLYVALDARILDESTFEELLSQAEEVGRVIGGLRSAVERQKANKRSGPQRSNAQSSALSTHSSALVSSPTQKR